MERLVASGIITGNIAEIAKKREAERERLLNDRLQLIKDLSFYLKSILSARKLIVDHMQPFLPDSFEPSGLILLQIFNPSGEESASEIRLLPVIVDREDMVTNVVSTRNDEKGGIIGFDYTHQYQVSVIAEPGGVYLRLQCELASVFGTTEELRAFSEDGLGFEKVDFSNPDSSCKVQSILRGAEPKVEDLTAIELSDGTEVARVIGLFIDISSTGTCSYEKKINQLAELKDNEKPIIDQVKDVPTALLMEAKVMKQLADMVCV